MAFILTLAVEETVEFVDAEINRWASGKQSNLRALLSTLHHVSH